MNSNEQYIYSERARLGRELLEVERQPLSERKQSAKDLECGILSNYEHFVTMLKFAANGDFGAGAYFALRNLSKRANREAWLFITTAALEYRCPQAHARQVYRRLPASLKERLHCDMEAILQEVDNEGHQARFAPR